MCTRVDVPRHRWRYNSGGGSFSGTLSGVGFCARWREAAARWKEKRRPGDGRRTRRKGGRVEGGDTRPLGRDEGAQGVGGV